MEFTDDEKDMLEKVAGWPVDLSELAYQITDLPNSSELCQLAHKYLEAENNLNEVLDNAVTDGLFEWG